jgi:hypothetical protein
LPLLCFCGGDVLLEAITILTQILILLLDKAQLLLPVAALVLNGLQLLELLVVSILGLLQLLQCGFKSGLLLSDRFSFLQLLLDCL